MNLTVLNRRSSIITALVAVGAGLTVFLFNDWFHDDFLVALGIPNPLGDALGTVLIVAVAYLAQRFGSVIFYRDQVFGLKSDQEKQQHSAQVMSALTEEVAGEMASVPTYNDVLRGQLASVVEQTEQAAYSITERLQSVDGVITRLGDFVAVSSAESTRLAASSEKQIQQNQVLMTEMRDYIDARIKESEQDQQRVSHIVAEARSLESLTRIIKELAGQTNLLALNAAIEAARAGEAGRGFAVVADEVRKLSNETEKAVLEINAGIRSVASTIENELKDKLSSVNLEKEKDALEKFANQLAELGDRYEHLMTHQGTVIDTVGQCSDDLATMFMEALASVQFQDVTRQQIEQISAALVRLDQHLAHLGNRLAQVESADYQYTPLAEHLDQMYSMYVMDTQRDTHQQSLKSDTAAARSSAGSAKVELF